VRAPRPGLLAGACFGLTLAAEAGAIGLSWGLTRAFDVALFSLYTLAVVGTGAVVATQQPRNPVGWILAGGGLLGVSGDLGPAWGLRAAERGWPGGPAGEWMGTAAWVPGVLMFTLVFLLTPTGRPPGPRWWVVAWVGLAGAVLLLPGWTLSAVRDPEFLAGSNPFVVRWLPHASMVLVGSMLLLAALAGSLASLAARLRSCDSVERQQLKWVAVAATVLVATVPAMVLLWGSLPLVRALAPLVLVACALALGAAVLRYRLYEVDLVINRTVVYAVVSFLLAGTYGVTAVTLGALLGGSSPWTVAGATLAAALLFRPARRAVQDLVDRRFDRERHSARARVASFVEGVRAGTERPERVEEVLRDVLRDPSLELLLRLPASGDFSDPRGRVAQLDTNRPAIRVERHGVLEAVVHCAAAADPIRQSQVRDVVEAGLLAVDIARVHVELNRQLAELERSRLRIASAADDERCRIQRDLHDGAQQRLVTAGITLRSVEARLRGSGQGEEADRLDGAVAELAATIEELRALAQRLPPPQLDAGISAAFDELAERAPLPVAVDVRVERLGRAIETTAYFVGCEGLTNVIKHASASTATLTAVRCNGTLVVSVADDGVGGAVPRPGSGLAGLADRVAAVGGQLQVRTEGPGTLVTAVLPCE
jgi:signal transduction histidine kinase